MLQDQDIIRNYLNFIQNKDFPCVAAKAALGKNQIMCLVANDMRCGIDDKKILEFIYSFIDIYRTSTGIFHSVTVIFREPKGVSENLFESLFWERLQSVSNLDAANYNYDNRVNNDPASNDFSYSLKGEAFFIIGLHPSSSRHTREFEYPSIVFNPHAQFQQLKVTNKYENLKKVVRKRDMLYSGSVNPMLNDFGRASEVYQYTGKVYNKSWKCPFKSNHGNEHH